MAEQGFASFDKLAKELSDPKRKLRDLPPKRSLAAYLGRLNKGIDGWFRHNEPVSRVLAGILKMSLDELLPPEVHGQKLWRFEEFAQLPQLDLEKEEPCDLFRSSQSDRLSVAAAMAMLQSNFSWQMYKITESDDKSMPLWVTAPPGAGKRLHSRWLEARKRVVVTEVARLRDAVGANLSDSENRRALVLVAEADPEGDREAISALAQVGAITIWAPYEFPHQGSADKKPEPDTWSQEKDRVVEGWTLKPWQMADDWRERLLNWIADRLKDIPSNFDAARLLAWLKHVDEEELILPTPGDMLPLCALVHERGPRWLGQKQPAEISHLLLGTQTERLPEDTEGRRWLMDSAPAVLRQLLTRKLSDIAAPLRGGLSSESCSSYLADSVLAVRPSESDVRTALKELRSLKGSTRQGAEETLVKRVTTPNPAETVSLLRAAGVLRTGRTGGLAVYPRWTQEYYLGEAAIEGVRKAPPLQWGRWAVDPERRELLDSALDELNPSELLSLVRNALATFEAAELGAVGAVESLFAAVGRRLRRDWHPNDPETIDILHRLWRKAESQLAPRDGRPDALRLPRTRVDDYWKQAEDFVAACWAWSLRLPMPIPGPPQDPPWLWPGWSTVTISDLKHVPVGSPSPSGRWEDTTSASGVAGLVVLLDEYLERCTDTNLPTSLPSFFALHVVIHAAKRGWSLASGRNLSWQSWHSAMLVNLAPKLSLEVRRQIANWRLVNLAPQRHSSLGTALIDLQKKDPDLYGFLVEHTDWVGLREKLAAYDAEALVRGVEGFPDSVQQWIIEQVAAREEIDIDRLITAMMEQRSPSPKALVERLLVEIVSIRQDYGYRVLRELYAINTQRALEMAALSWRRNPEIDQTIWWFTVAPDSFSVRAPLISLIREMPPNQRPKWTHGFLTAMLHYAREHTDDLFRLIQGCE